MTPHSLFDLDTYLASRRDLVDAKLDELLPKGEPAVLWESMRYSVLSSGKRIRALLAIAAFETIRFGTRLLNDVDVVLPLACAIEMVHAMSLIHDDLPCLDNDDIRRGKPTNHKVFGEAIALLAGDALLMKAVDVLICSTDISSKSDSRRSSNQNAGKSTSTPKADLIRSLPEAPSSSPALSDHAAMLDIVGRMTEAAGASGMVGGQVFDLEYTGSLSRQKEIELDEEIVRKIHSRKTGALIRFSLWSGARLAQADDRQLITMEKFGNIMGLAFQITDDLLDVVGDKETLGKTPGKDQAAKKATWVSVFGVEGAREKLIDLEQEGKVLLNEEKLVSDDWPILASLLELAIHRTR